LFISFFPQKQQCYNVKAREYSLCSSPQLRWRCCVQKCTFRQTLVKKWRKTFRRL